MKNLQNRYVIATIKSWNIDAAKRLVAKQRKKRIMVITKKETLKYHKINKFRPKYIFFPHWSWWIPREIYKNFQCIGFHMTDLPFGRGGSPLQNLLARGITKTKISAIKIIERIDAGPIYLKRKLSLHGSAGEIYKRASRIIFEDMIPYIIRNEPMPLLQKGKIVKFKRRKSKASRIPYNIDLDSIYNYIRMLDAEDYPPAFIETQKLRFEFTETSKKNNYIYAKVRIKKKGESNEKKDINNSGSSR